MLAPLRFLLCTALLAACVVAAFPQNVSDTELRSAVQAQLASFLEKVPAGREADYGFHARQEFTQIVVGNPYQVYTVEPESLIRGTADLSTYVHPVREYQVPLLVGGEFRALVTVAPVSGRWKLVEFGGAGLARVLGAFDTSIPKTQAGRKVILRIYQLQTDYLVLIDPSRLIGESIVYGIGPAASAMETLSPTDEGYHLGQLMPILRGELSERFRPDERK
jgi:hypothetical protein